MHFVDVWLGGLAADDDMLQGYAGLLDGQELEKAGAFGNPLMRNRFVAVRGMLRTVLAGYLDADPAGLQFSAGEHGKPALICHRLHFNLSHSVDALAIAVSDLDAIGIDIEQIRPRNGLIDIARRCFTEREFDAWSSISAPRQQQAFYRLWTMKEAFVKAVGRGIALGLDQCEVEMPEGLRFAKVPEGYGTAADWKIVELSTDADFCGALVAPNVEFVFRQYRLESNSF